MDLKIPNCINTNAREMRVWIHEVINMASVLGTDCSYE